MDTEGEKKPISPNMTSYTWYVPEWDTSCDGFLTDAESILFSHK